MVTFKKLNLVVPSEILGQFYFFKTAVIISNNKLWNENTSFIELNEMESHDIDTIEDWEVAEFKYKYLNKK